MLGLWGGQPAFLGRRHATVRCLLLVAFIILITNFVLWRDHDTWDDIIRPERLRCFGCRHPIRTLMAEAETRFHHLLEQQSRTIQEAASRYRARRGRHPPPGFDRWFQAALDADAVVVEDFFDRIYKDLTPFWALDPDSVKEQANAWEWVISVRQGSAQHRGDIQGRVPWLQLWTALVADFATHLPDVDMPINMMDEPRLLVPWATIANLVEQERETRRPSDLWNVTSTFQGSRQGNDSRAANRHETKWLGLESNHWSLAVDTCGPDTPAYGVEQAVDFTPPVQLSQHWQASYSYRGFVQNRTAAIDPCQQPHIRELHGTFIEPISMSTTKELLPLFGGSKMPMNNDILIPGAMYLTDDPFYSGGDAHGPPWAEKEDGLVWRGAGTGGRARQDTWHRLQRHRLVEMLNATNVARAEASGGRARAFQLPSTRLYNLSHQKKGQLASWLRRFTDAAFVFLCHENECEFLAPFFKLAESMPMEQQYRYKFLPDVDGNSFSARFRGFLRSTSLPLKATIYTEWHDDRLVPWLHFVPLDNTYQDLYPVLDFFAGGHGDAGDAAARFIAERGQKWTERSLRREDMRLYLWRLLLEWARVCDSNRHSLGFIGDLVS